jgi:hypothetical protein
VGETVNDLIMKLGIKSQDLNTFLKMKLGIKYLFNETGYQFTRLAEFYFDKA